MYTCALIPYMRSLKFGVWIEGTGGDPARAKRKIGGGSLAQPALRPASTLHAQAPGLPTPV